MAIFTPAHWGLRGLTAVVFGITYSLAAVFSGIVFVLTALAKPFFWIFRRKPSGAGSIDVSNYEATGGSTEVSTEVPVEELPPESSEDATEVPTSPSIELPDQTSDLTDQTSGPAATISIMDRITGIPGSFRSSLLEMIQRDQDSIDKAEPYYRKALEIRTEINHISGLIQSYHALAYLHIKQNRSEEAVALFEKSAEMAKAEDLKNELQITRQLEASLQSYLRFYNHACRLGQIAWRRDLE